MKASLALLDVHSALRARLRIQLDPALDLFEGRVSVFPHAVELGTHLAIMPRGRMLIKHLEIALVAGDFRVLGLIFIIAGIELAARATGSKAPSKAGEPTQRLETKYR